MSRAEDVIAEAVHGSGDIACRCKPGDEWWCADRKEGLVYEREQANAVIEAIRNLSPDDLAELIDGEVESEPLHPRFYGPGWLKGRAVGPAFTWQETP